MRVKGIHIVNFRGCGEFSRTESSKVLRLCGPNGTGKTTVLDAIRFVLTGTVRDNTGSSCELKRLVGPNAPKGHIYIVLADDAGKELAINLKFSATKSTLETEPVLPGKINEVRAGIWEYFGLDAKRERLALDPLILLLGDDLLASLSGDAALDETKVAGVFGGQWDKVKALLERHRVTFKAASDVDKAKTTLYDIRTKINRKAKELDTLLAQGVKQQPTTAKGNLLTSEDIPRVEVRLKTLKSNMAELNLSIAGAGKGRSREEINHEIKAAELAIRRHQAQRPIIPEEPQFDDPPEPVSDEDYRQAQIEVERYRMDASRLSNLNENCPTCGRPMAGVEDQRKVAARAQAIYDKAKEKFAELDEKYQAYKLHMQLRNAAIDEHKRKIAVAGARWDSENTRLEVVLYNLKGETPVSQSVDELLAQRSKLETTIEEGQALLTRLREWTEYQKQKAEWVELDKESELLTWVIEILADPATAKSLGDDQSAAFERDMCDFLEPFGYRVRCNWDDSVVEFSETTRDAWRRVSEISAGELAIVQFGIAEVYGGAGLALIDRYEGVDAENAKKIEWALEYPSGGRVIAMTA